MQETKLTIRGNNLTVTNKGVVIEGDAAGRLATLLIQHREQVLSAVRQLDTKIGLDDIYVDEAGRVVLRSARLQQFAYEAVRIGATAANPKGLGRLVKRTGSKIGTVRTAADAIAESREIGGRKSPAIKGQASGSLDFFCASNDGAVNLVCYEGDFNEAPEVDCFCGWGNY